MAESTTVTYLIQKLRYKLWDIDATNYRYLDEWLEASLLTAIISLQRWWYDKYLVDETTKLVTRNVDTSITFVYEEPPVIQQPDETPIVLMASVLVKGGQLENNSWNVGSWKDAEISVSNIEGNRAKLFGYSKDWEELMMYLTPPSKRLAKPVRQSVPDEEDYQG